MNKSQRQADSKLSFDISLKRHRAREQAGSLR